MRTLKLSLTFSLFSLTALAALITTAGAQRRTATSEHPRLAAAASPKLAVDIPRIPPAVRKLSRMVESPEDLDRATSKLGIEPRLLNFHLAAPIDLTSKGLGRVVHIPVQISERAGGRKSLYYLNPGEEVLAGIFVTDGGVALRYVKRLSGRGVPASTGDAFETRVTNTEGRPVYEERGRLEVLDASRGIGTIVTPGGGDPQEIKVWVYWSCIYVEVEADEIKKLSQ